MSLQALAQESAALTEASSNREGAVASHSPAPLSIRVRCVRSTPVAGHTSMSYRPVLWTSVNVVYSRERSL
jgi:hypothetical protein